MESPQPHLQSYLKIFENGFEGELVDLLSTLFDRSPQHSINEDWRRCTNVQFPNGIGLVSDLAWTAFRKRIGELFKQYKEELGPDGGSGSLNFVGHIEQPNLFKYIPSTSPNLFHAHSDCWNDDSASRQVSVIAYLNDVEEGGETIFPYYDLTIKPKRGTVLLFPSNFAFIHRAEPPISGDKLIAVTWLHFGPKTGYRTFPL